MWVFYRSCYQFAMIAMMLGSLSACLVGPDFETPEPLQVNHYTKPSWPCRTASAPDHGGASQQFIQTKTISAEWWRLFHSPKINKLICRGIANSPNLTAAYTNLFLVKQQFRLGGVSYLSLLDAQRQYQQTRISLVQAEASRYTDTAALFQALWGGRWNSNCRRGSQPCSRYRKIRMFLISEFFNNSLSEYCTSEKSQSLKQAQYVFINAGDIFLLTVSAITVKLAIKAFFHSTSSSSSKTAFHHSHIVIPGAE